MNKLIAFLVFTFTVIAGFSQCPIPDFKVTPASCLELEDNVFFISEDQLTQPIEIIVNDQGGNKFDGKVTWSPIQIKEYEYFYDVGSGQSGWSDVPNNVPDQENNQIPGLIVLNHIRKTAENFELINLNATLIKDGCPNLTESITIIAGGLRYKDFCFGDTKNLDRKSVV